MVFFYKETTQYISFIARDSGPLNKPNYALNEQALTVQGPLLSTRVYQESIFN